MPTGAHLLLLFSFGLSSIFADANEVELSSKSNYEQCWQVLEELCERNGSVGCAELVKLCGQLLTQHLSEAHRPTPELVDCSQDQPETKQRLLNRRRYACELLQNRYLEELQKKTSPNGTAMSVMLSEKLAPLAEGTGGIGLRILDLTQGGKGRQNTGEASKPAQNPETESSRRNNFESDLRGILPTGQTTSYLIPLEKRTGYRPPPPPRPRPYTDSVHDYRQSFLETKGGLVMDWLSNNDRGFRDFLKFWKNVMVYQQ